MKNDTNIMSEHITWSTTENPLTPEEEDAIVLVVIIVAVLAAIIFLFFMGVFIDCRTQKPSVNGAPSKRKRMRLKMPPLGRAQRQGFSKQRLDDSRYLHQEPSGVEASSAFAVTSLDAVV